MTNYLLYPIVELKGYIILTVAVLFLLTVIVIYMMGKHKSGLGKFGFQSILFNRTTREILWMSLGLSQVTLVFSIIIFFVPVGTVQITALALLCVGKGLLGLSFTGAVGELVFGGLTGTALMAGNLLMDYMKETGADLYILLIWGLLSLFVMQYVVYFFIKGMERMLRQHERAGQRKKQKKEK